MEGKNTPIQKCIREIEEKLGWGSSNQWTHQDFLNLSEKILEETGSSLSYITLKRIWGKVTYHSLPNTQTLNILAQFVGYESWRVFKNQQAGDQPILPGVLPLDQRRWRLLRNIAGMAALALIALLIIPSANDQPALNSDDFQFSSKKVVSQGIPNSVIFDIEASRSPYDSVEVQQSWDARRRTKIPKEQTQHTSIYYYPGFFEAKLVVGGKIVKEHGLHITTNGWYCAIQQDPVPVYFPLEEVLGNGKVELTYDQVRAKNIELQPTPPLTRIGNSTDFGDLTTDHFVLEANLKNTYREGSSICQYTRVYLLCEGKVIIIPLAAKGCVSSLSLNFVNHYASGKNTDLSAFGVAFDDIVHLKIESIRGNASIFVNNQLAYTVPEKIKPVAIKGIDFRFQGLGAIDEVKLGRPGDNWIFADSFTRIN